MQHGYYISVYIDIGMLGASRDSSRLFFALHSRLFRQNKIISDINCRRHKRELNCVAHRIYCPNVKKTHFLLLGK